MLDVDTSVLAAVLGAALLHASWNALWKKRGDSEVTATGLSACWAVVGWACVLTRPTLPAEAWPHVVASVAVHVVYLEVLRHAYRHGDLSHVYSVARGVPPLLVALGAGLWFGEWIGVVGLAGVTLVSVGVLLAGAGRARSAATGFALLSATCTAVYTLLDGAGTRASDPWTYATTLMAGQGVTYVSVSLWRGGRPLAARVWAQRTVGVVAGVVSAFGYFLALWAMARAPIAAVAALRETSVIFATLLGVVWLGEPAPRRRIVAAGMVAVGAAVVRLG